MMNYLTPNVFTGGSGRWKSRVMMNDGGRPIIEWGGDDRDY